MKKTIDSMVRDFTQVIPRSKSEVRRRITELLLAESELLSVVEDETLRRTLKKIEKDLLKIADEGEYEDLRREVIEYFKDNA